MILENVKVGDTFSTETKMFRQLGLIPPKGGKALGDMRKLVKEHLDYEKTGKISRQGKLSNEVGITEIRDIPIKSVDGRINNGNHKYPEFDSLIVDYLSRVKSKEITTRQLAVAIKAIDNTYKEYDNRQNYILKELQDKMWGINSWHVYMFFKYVKEKCLDNIDTCIKRLSKQGKIKSDKYMLIVDEGGYDAHIANDKEVDIIQNNERLALEQLIDDGVIPDNTSLGLVKGHYIYKKKFNRLVEDYNREDGIKMYWNTYKLESVECNTLDDCERDEMIKRLRISLSTQIKETMSNYKYVAKKYKRYIGKTPKDYYNKPFSVDNHDGSGYYIMLEVVNYFFNIKEDTKSIAINALTDCQRGLIKYDLYKQDDLIPRCFKPKEESTKESTIDDDIKVTYSEITHDDYTWDDETECAFPF